MKEILLVGAGQLGSRHLQALNLLPQSCKITVVEPNAEALDIAKSRFDASIQSIYHTISYQRELANLSHFYDIAIIASTAESRCAIIENLLNQAQVNHLVLEKLLFTRAKDYAITEQTLAKHKTHAWVNCTMRMMPFYRQLHQLFANKPLNYRVSGSQYGLITNAIHYLDHVAYLTQDTEFTLNTDYLDKQIIPSKRSGYFEITGTLIAQFSQGSMAFLHCSKEGAAPIQIELFSNEHRIISREWEQKAWQTSLQQDWAWDEVNAPIPFQSTLTAELVKSLLETNQCSLTDYATSMKIHLQLLEPLKLFIDKIGFKNPMEYPFT